MKEEGFVRDVVVEDRHLKVLLKYVNGESVIHEINRISTPSKRIYKGGDSIKPVIGGLGISVVTTIKVS